MLSDCEISDTARSSDYTRRFGRTPIGQEPYKKLEIRRHEPRLLGSVVRNLETRESQVRFHG